MRVPIALTIAGSDPSGGAGLQADLKTFHSHGVYGTAVVTLVTVQNTLGVTRVDVLEPSLVTAQLDAVVADLPPAAAKTGALGSAGVIRAVADRVAALGCPLVVDPVVVSKHGHRLIEDDAVVALRAELLPLAAVVTPNVHEAALLTGLPVRDRDGMLQAAFALRDAGAACVVVKGAALPDCASDVVVTAQDARWLDGERVTTTSLHGSGCAFSAALTARLARGESVLDALRGAKAWVTRALRSAPGLGAGVGPLDLLVDGRDEAPRR
ncbi:MAG: bifunctional hydroxymethylpyrimidine kinase/phosphomethylpyrimidine kinase [Planctomycetes bacterium]|nr:bifunctional hydroxymethylpyrimidine kinase/phosphomethylpyrimidine kinase [Planctomycetota bacterium]